MSIPYVPSRDLRKYQNVACRIAIATLVVSVVPAEAVACCAREYHDDGKVVCARVIVV